MNILEDGRQQELVPHDLSSLCTLAPAEIIITQDASETPRLSTQDSTPITDMHLLTPRSNTNNKDDLC